jgi:hypothetical protein
MAVKLLSFTFAESQTNRVLPLVDGSMCDFQLFIPFLTTVLLLEAERPFRIFTVRKRTAKIGHLHIYTLWFSGGDDPDHKPLRIV